MEPGDPIRVELARRIVTCAHLTGEFTLRSGAVSDEYFDKYRFEADPGLLREAAEALAALLPAGIDAVAGLELGGIPLVTMVSQLTGLPARFVRKRPKSYGTRRFAEGGEISGWRLAVIEDVVSTAGALIASCRALRAEGATIAAVLCVIDRESGGAENLAREGLELQSAFTLGELRSAGGA